MTKMLVFAACAAVLSLAACEPDSKQKDAAVVPAPAVEGGLTVHLDANGKPHVPSAEELKAEAASRTSSHVVQTPLLEQPAPGGGTMVILNGKGMRR